MKKTYEKPTLVRRDTLVKLTASMQIISREFAEEP
jgi:hypothetical protein